ncbi:PH domain-containing protein [Kibdelosporangium persicum]|uniref:Low molecular weight protein antigen 6 PH domain-containing protein n=1 Tax=Kibdelosporangium persicum TaxID=2698649 RepID=A0ABX2FB86_9PSEU|nr:PH domain-containing protein [Kibdelosporangium persicum]NRN68180.1 hypothetical protein [Kibdelosporangium persicum]
MENDRVVYRVSVGLVSVLTAILLVVGALLLVALSLNDASAGVLIGMGAGWLVFTAFMLMLAVRPSTVVSGAGVQVRRAFDARTLPWARIADIQTEEVSGQSAAHLQVSGVALYDVDGQRVVLPYLHNKRLKPERFEAALNDLRRRWEAGR